MRNGRPPTSHSMHSFLHQYTGSFKKPPLRRPHSVIGGTLGSFMAMPRNGSRLGEPRLTSPHLSHVHKHTLLQQEVSDRRSRWRPDARQETCHDSETSPSAVLVQSQLVPAPSVFLLFFTRITAGCGTQSNLTQLPLC